MPSISRIRFCNVIYENGAKRYNDETFLFDGHNTAFLLENGGGKTVFIQTALQAIIPHIPMAERKIKDTLSLENAPAHIAIEWIIHDKPRRYALTAVSLFIENNALNSLKYTYDYDAQDSQGIEDLPFSIMVSEGKMRPSTRGEMSDYYTRMNRQSPHANVFATIQDYGRFIENTYKIIPSEWRKVATINSGEGNVDEFFSKCRTTDQLLANLLIPVVEEAIEGDHSEGFVETFQRQREHFKKNRILQDKIEQSQLIKERMDDYVDVYALYEKERLELQSLRREAKTVSNYVKNQLANRQNELALNEQNHQVLKKDMRLFEQEQKSFDLYLMQSQLRDLEVQQKELENRLADEQERYDTMAARKQNIELTALAKEVASEEAHLKVLREELTSMDEQVEIADVKQQLAENSSQIKGQFVYELELIDREIHRIDTAIRDKKSQIKELEKRFRDAEAYEKDLIGKRSHLEAALGMKEAQKSQLQRELFGDGPDITISLHKDGLLSRQRQMAKDKTVYEHRMDELKQIINTKSQASDNLVAQKVQLKAEHSTASEKLKQLNGEMADLTASVEAAGYPLFMTGSIYSKEASVLRELEEQRETALNQKEKALRQERRTLRQFDLYEDLSHFMGEPMLEPFVLEMKDRVEFLELGSQHMASLKKRYDKPVEELSKVYPYWAVTLVTSVKDIAEVKRALYAKRDQLSHMVLVITREEANRIAQGQSPVDGSLADKGLFPTEWQDSLDPEHYYEWQQRLRTMAHEAMSARKEKEQQFFDADRRLTQARVFFDKYPYEDYESLKATIEDCEGDLRQVTADQQALDTAIREDQDSLFKLSSLLNELSVKGQQIEAELRLVEQYEKITEAYEDVTLSLAEATSASTDHEKQLDEIRHRLGNLIDDERMLTADRQRFDVERSKVMGLELYEEVKDAEPYGTNTSLESLKEQRHVLKNRLAGLSRTRQEVEDRLLEHEKLKKRYTHELQKMEHEARYPYRVIEAYYEGEAEALFDKMGRHHLVTEQLRAQAYKTEKSVTQTMTRCQVIEESLNRDYGGVITFDIESHHIDQRLKVNRATLKDRSRKLAKEKNAIETMIHRFDLTYRELEIKDGTYHYMGTDVEAMTLEADYFDGFDEQPEDQVRAMLSSLEGQYTIAHKAHSKVLSKQSSVLQYCRSHVTDRRLLETLATGLSEKNDYEALLIYQEKMTEIIHKIIKVAEDDKRESDLELQTYLSHLMAYVKSVAAELDVIQSKTRITLNEQVRQIFIFDIPVWEDEVARANLRSYIDETIHYYEKESLHEEVNEDQLRRSLTERLSVMRLLEVVMDGQSIKIKCRKVTNDMNINKAPMSWESSNKWSGGEKWSKNMTLFLSILNYLAEKKQHLSQNQKRHRSVILDNPFGKASSDHVLRPVFMVAESLGFQIIALTAHAEGKFISDYFPVVYSCRLRATTDPNKQIMTNEKILNHTYLREHAPMTLMRLQEVEQISLF